MTEIKLLQCDVCDRRASSDGDDAVTRYEISTKHKRVRVDLCEDDSTWIRDLVERMPAAKKRRTFDDLKVASVEDIPRSGAR